MAIAFGGTASDTTGSGSISLTGVTAGATIVLLVQDGNNVATGFAASDAQGSYTAKGAIFGTGSGAVSARFLTLLAANSGTHTIACSVSGAGSGYFGATAAWYTGAGDLDNTTNGAFNAAWGAPANSWNSGTITPSTNLSQIIGWALNGNNASAITAGTSPNAFTNRAAPNYQGFAGIWEDFNQTTAAAVAATATINTGGLIMVASLKPAGAAGDNFYGQACL